MSFNKRIYVGIIFAVFGFCATAQADDQKCVTWDKASLTDLSAMQQSLEELDECLRKTGEKIVDTGKSLLESHKKLNKLLKEYDIPEIGFAEIATLLEKQEITETGVKEIKKLLEKYGIILSEEETESLLEDL